MNPAERTVFEKCVKKTTELFKRRNLAEEWANNLIEGSKGLTTGNQWKHFYAWLSNPDNYNEEEVNALKTIGTEIPSNLEDYPDYMKVETFQNGVETLVYVTHKDKEDEEDEKKEE